MAPQKCPATPDCLLKREVLEAMKWVVMDECAHGPVLRNHFAGETNDAPKCHAAGIGIDRTCYFLHAASFGTRPPESRQDAPSPVPTVR